MSHDDLIKALETVQQELEQADHLDPSDVKKLKQTTSEIESTIAAKADQELTLSQRVGESAKEFEASHPILTKNLSQIADILQRMGF